MRTENAHTAPSSWCAHPEHWHARDDQATEVEVSELVAGFVRALQPELVVETGTHFGQTARMIGSALAKNGHGHLITVEQDPAVAALAAEWLRHLPATVIAGDSLAVLPGALDGRGPVGFAWVDSGARSRRKEVVALAPYLDIGAVVGVHDTRPGRPTAGAFDRDAFDVLTLRTPRGVSFAQLRRDAHERSR